MEFEKMSENDIINLAQRGKMLRWSIFWRNISRLFAQKTRKLFLIDGDKDDLIQEGM